MQYFNNRKHIKKEYDKKYRKVNHAKRILSVYARKNHIILRGVHTDEEWQHLVREYKNRCGYCAQKTQLTRDHRKPIFRGGCNHIHNIIPACSSCNLRKHTKTEQEFRLENNYRLSHHPAFLDYTYL